MSAGNWRCPAAALVALVTLSVSGHVVAGPTVPEASLPGFTDPLAHFADAPAADSDQSVSLPDGTGPAGEPNPADAAPASATSPVTVLGGTAAGPLPVDDTDGALEAVRQKYLGRGSFSTGTPVTSNQLPVSTAPSASTPSLASIARSLMNAIPSSRGANGAGPDSPSGAQSSDEEQATRSFIDDTVGKLVIDILNPQVSADGLVTFSIAGLGKFALMLSDETGSVFMIDLERGTAIKIYEESRPTTNLINMGRNLPGTGAPQLTHGNSDAVQRMLGFLHRNVYPILTSPITLSMAALFSIIWVVWRISSRQT